MSKFSLVRLSKKQGIVLCRSNSTVFLPEIPKYIPVRARVGRVFSTYKSLSTFTNLTTLVWYKASNLKNINLKAYKAVHSISFSVYGRKPCFNFIGSLLSANGEKCLTDSQKLGTQQTTSYFDISDSHVWRSLTVPSWKLKQKFQKW